jgi:hypothetical protein
MAQQKWHLRLENLRLQKVPPQGAATEPQGFFSAPEPDGLGYARMLKNKGIFAEVALVRLLRTGDFQSPALPTELPGHSWELHSEPRMIRVEAGQGKPDAR